MKEPETFDVPLKKWASYTAAIFKAIVYPYQKIIVISLGEKALREAMLQNLPASLVSDIEREVFQKLQHRASCLFS